MEQETNQADFSAEESKKDDEPNTKRKGDAIFELVLILILGFLLGVTIKTEAVKRVTIGFNDYKVQQTKQAYDFEAINAKLKQAQEEAQGQQQEAPADTAEPTQAQ